MSRPRSALRSWNGPTMGLYPHGFLGTTVAEDIAARGVNLPSWPDMSEDDFALVSDGIEGFFADG
jgi:perosamine synthetase